MTPYATAEQLNEYLPDGVDIPADAVRMLSRASELLDDRVRRSFAVGDDDLPTDPDIAEALQLAACAQVEYWILGPGEEHDVEGMHDRRVSVGHLSVDALPAELAPRALRHLRAARLVSAADLDTAAHRFFATPSGA